MQTTTIIAAELVAFEITPASPAWDSKVVIASDADEAVAKYTAARTKPQYCKCHSEIADRHSAPIGEMGMFTPAGPEGPFKVRQMREVYIGGGYSWVEAA